MIGFAYERSVAGQLVPGIIATTNDQSIDSTINDILIVAENMSESEMRERVVVFLPLRGE